MLSDNGVPRYVFLCNSPLQVLNAYEARHHFNLEQGDCVLVIVPLSQNLDSLIRVSKLQPWAEIILTPPRPAAALLKISGLWSYLCQRAAYIRCWQKDLRIYRGRVAVFLAYTSLEDTRVMAAWLRPENIMYLDDGTLTATVLDWLKLKGGTLSFWERTKRPVSDIVYSPSAVFSLRFARRILQLLRGWLRSYVLSCQARYFGIRSGLSFPFKIFTVYANEDSGCLVRNERRYVRSLMQEKFLDAGLVHFLGAPLVERGLVDKHIYFRWLRQVKKFFAGRIVTYVPHPAESDGFVRELIENTGLQSVRFKMPYEVVFATSDMAPSAVSSWFCSALENILDFDVPEIELVAFRVRGLSSGSTDIRQAAEDFYLRHAINSRICVQPLM